MFRTDFALQPALSQCATVCHELERHWIAVLHSNQAPNAKTQRLLAAIGATSTHVATWGTGAASAATFAGFDLIVYEAMGDAPATMQAVLCQIRTKSKAPLVALTSSAHAEHTVTALRAGADAVISLTLHQEIITAHLFAMLRRWGRRPHYTHPSFATAPLAQMP